ncbi:MAG: hypothetical protein MI741_15415, partial [Rhodospirillales bacterium]|nr:hypothetical protein [Rhodospirillales bacterium]
MNIWQQTALSLAAGLCFAHVSYAGTMSYRNTVLGDNPIIYYEFDETTGTTSSNIGSSGAAND